MSGLALLCTSPAWLDPSPWDALVMSHTELQSQPQVVQSRHRLAWFVNTHQKRHQKAPRRGVCRWLEMLEESPDRPCLSDNPEFEQNRPWEWCRIQGRCSHREGRGMCRGWNAFKPDTRAAGTAALSGTSPLTVLAESLWPPKMGTLDHAQTCTSEGCESAETVLCKDPGVTGPFSWSLPVNSLSISEIKT